MDNFGIYTKNQVSKKLTKILKEISHFEKISFGLNNVLYYYYVLYIVHRHDLPFLKWQLETEKMQYIASFYHE